jgi:hypothetical protein
MVVGVKRYGRPVNKSLLGLIQMKHLEHGRWGFDGTRSLFHLRLLPELDAAQKAAVNRLAACL